MLAMIPALRYCRGILAWSVIFTLLLRALVPAGFMPDFAHGTLMVCDGHTHHHDGQTHDTPCPFAVGALFSFDGVHTVSSVVIALVVAVLGLFVLPLREAQPVFTSARPRAPLAFS